MKKLITTLAAVGLLAASSVAGACTLSAWSSQSGTAPIVGGPGDTNVLARFGGICSMQADSGTQYVQDNSPSGEGTLNVRFYVLGAGSGNADIFAAYSDEGGSSAVFTVNVDGSNVTVTPASGTAATAAMSTGWNSIEVNWAAGGDISLWVNSDATLVAANGTGSDSAGSVTVESVRLGAIAGLGGFTTLNFDDYESRRTTPIGQLCTGDADGSGTVNVVDASLVVAERLGQNTATGAPDCSGDGTINVVDASCIVAIRLGPTSGVCP